MLGISIDFMNINVRRKIVMIGNLYLFFGRGGVLGNKIVLIVWCREKWMMGNISMR